jgi:hypothetical protein
MIERDLHVYLSQSLHSKQNSSVNTVGLHTVAHMSCSMLCALIEWYC